MKWSRVALGLTIACLSGCGEPLEGFVWEVTLTAVVDECNDPTNPYRETFDYVVDLAAAPDVTIGLGHEVFAIGRVSGDFVDYESVIWREERLNGDEIAWQITGEAQFRTGGTNGSLPDGVDWEGTEQFEIIDSEDPDLEPGCRFMMEAEGVFKEQL